MTSYRGITWNHPRGKNALLAAAAEARAAGSLDIEWQAHSLEHFESHPIDDLAQNFDLIVLDHPHLGEALALGSLQPLDAVVGPERIAAWASESVGPSFSSYSAGGSQWALPLDAATQVAVHKPALLDPADVPATWPDVEALAASGRVPVALSLAGPHAFLTFASACVAFGDAVGGPDAAALPPGDDGFVATATGIRVLELMRDIASRAPAGSDTWNPIALLQRMTDTDEVGYCPLVYGYVNYSSPDLRFADAPAAAPGGRRGSTIGGTGLALSARARVTPELVEHIEWLMSPDAQARFIPQHDGQPSARAAWLDPEVNHASHDFYRGTLATLDDSWVRPRFSGYIAFQSHASAVIRDVVAGRVPVPAGLAELREAYSHALAASRSHDRVPNDAFAPQNDFSMGAARPRPQERV
ncbi:type 2 periplasmic-binding domain-containing protein [Herbiconiux daphne]|uniref:Extracellular solute-binding protein n=1 Tax=Herbiconiux daphne TaxID=2970914 RepID=A0ABT2H7P2_9MICO|nr:extracellular solute-binding protein [Herbiconiux daphne]MCS5735975.1 extracellular solute-binding protein [Herbiconiux daphne]